MNKRNTRFDGNLGEYNTVWNTLVRNLGKTKASDFKRYSRERYKRLAIEINSSANEYLNLYGINVRHPNVKVPSFYGMTEGLKEKLKEEKKHMVLAYKSEWLDSKVKEWIIYNLTIISESDEKENDTPS